MEKKKLLRKFRKAYGKSRLRYNGLVISLTLALASFLVTIGFVPSGVSTIMIGKISVIVIPIVSMLAFLVLWAVILEWNITGPKLVLIEAKPYLAYLNQSQEDTTINSVYPLSQHEFVELLPWSIEKKPRKFSLPSKQILDFSLEELAKSIGARLEPNISGEVSLTIQANNDLINIIESLASQRTSLKANTKNEIIEPRLEEMKKSSSEKIAHQFLEANLFLEYPNKEKIEKVIEQLKEDIKDSVTGYDILSLKISTCQTTVG